ncbi:DNA-binding transcriptional regulator BolA isoform X2 [Tachypleus tridentatus]|uniref:DNA-binding transcriptional regulator BolA isoform X2 n=1 Tax=Tachypleus tridentatus TaxID=6853 RepID=UPI003FD3142D
MEEQFPEDVQLCLKRKTYQSIKKRVLSSVTAPEEELIKSSIKEKLLKHFQPVYIDITNESSKHNVPKGSETHFRVCIVSHHFEEQSLVQRHRHVNHVLQDELKGPVHALAIETFTPSQWESNEIRRNKSPPCRGGKRV